MVLSKKSRATRRTLYITIDSIERNKIYYRTYAQIHTHVEIYNSKTVLWGGKKNWRTELTAQESERRNHIMESISKVLCWLNVNCNGAVSSSIIYPAKPWTPRLRQQLRREISPFIDMHDEGSSSVSVIGAQGVKSYFPGRDRLTVIERN